MPQASYLCAPRLRSVAPPALPQGGLEYRHLVSYRTLWLDWCSLKCGRGCHAESGLVWVPVPEAGPRAVCDVTIARQLAVCEYFKNQVVACTR
eukprot:scaffold7694_cov430-Prasinococcus_capsulatus_cf.AAC.3